MSCFQWTKKRSQAAELIAEGLTNKEVAAEIGISERTIYRWYHDTTFSTEVDRLSLMLGLANRAARLRYAKKRIREEVEKTQDKHDLLDWLKYLQSETDGIKLDLANTLTGLITAINEIPAPLAGSGQGRTGSQAETETGETEE